MQITKKQLSITVGELNKMRALAREHGDGLMMIYTEKALCGDVQCIKLCQKFWDEMNKETESATQKDEASCSIEKPSQSKKQLN